MRLERNSLIAITLLFMAGCSANRQARQSDNVSDATDPVPLPMRHADEYDSGARDHEYEYEPALPGSDRQSPSRTPVPMGEPVPAPPAIGVSRVKSVSWLRGAGSRSRSNKCGDNAGGNGCSAGQQSHLPADYFTEGCITSPRSATIPRSRCREKTNSAEVTQGWNLGAGTHRPKRVQTSHNCGEGWARDPGFIVPEGCNSSVTGRKSNHLSPPAVKQYIGGVPVAPGTAPHGKHGGSLADPLKEHGWDDQGGTDDRRSSPDEMLDLPSTPETPVDEHAPQNTPAVPVTEPMPVLPMPETAPRLLPAPAVQNSAPSAALPQQINRDSVKRTMQPPLWPRLGAAAAISDNTPVASPVQADDSSLPAIQPGRRI